MQLGTKQAYYAWVEQRKLLERIGFFLQIFHDRRLLRAHLRRFHSNAEVFCCEKCGKTFKDKRSAKVSDVTGPRKLELSKVLSWSVGEGRHSTEVAFALLSQQPRVRILVGTPD